MVQAIEIYFFKITISHCFKSGIAGLVSKEVSKIDLHQKDPKFSELNRKEVDLKSKELDLKSKELGLRSKDLDLKHKEVGLNHKEDDLNRREADTAGLISQQSKNQATKDFI